MHILLTYLLMVRTNKVMSFCSRSCSSDSTVWHQYNLSYFTFFNHYWLIINW